MFFPEIDVVAEAEIAYQPFHIDMTDPDSVARAIEVLTAHLRTLTRKDLPHAV